jgi:hypothetical protein
LKDPVYYLYCDEPHLHAFESELSVFGSLGDTDVQLRFVTEGENSHAGLPSLPLHLPRDLTEDPSRSVRGPLGDDVFGSRTYDGRYTIMDCLHRLALRRYDTVDSEKHTLFHGAVTAAPMTHYKIEDGTPTDTNSLLKYQLGSITHLRIVRCDMGDRLPGILDDQAATLQSVELYHTSVRLSSIIGVAVGVGLLARILEKNHLVVENCVLTESGPPMLSLDVGCDSDRQKHVGTVRVGCGLEGEDKIERELPRQTIVVSATTEPLLPCYLCISQMNNVQVGGLTHFDTQDSL